MIHTSVSIVSTVFIVNLLLAGESQSTESNGHQSTVDQSKAKLIVLMVDSFRFDYLDLPGTIGFKKFALSGARSKWVTPVFPSKTYPNMFAQVTGMYAEEHGVVDNNLFDVDHEQLFYASGHTGDTTYVVDEDGSNEFWWNQSEPIWIAAERQGYRTAMFYWTGCHVAFLGVRATFCERYKPLVGMDWSSYEELYTDVMRRTVFNLTTGEWDMVMIYYGMIDYISHSYGIYSDKFATAFAMTDSIILKLLTLLELNGLRETTNVIIMSDHGMHSKKNNQTNPIVDLSKYLSREEDFDPNLGSGAIVQIWPKSEAILEAAYANLTRNKIKGANVYLKEDLPEKFHLKNNKRTSPIVVVAEPGYNVNFFRDSWSEMGIHGYDPDVSTEMRGTFLATGPAFKKNFTSRNSMVMTDHYNVFCRILGIEGHPNNGTLDRAMDLFA